MSTSVFAAVLAVVFGVWCARERTLSIHSIVTMPRELFYWLAVLVTFALGTAAGDWTLELTGWGPGTSVLLPAALIVAIVIGWRLGANAVLSFWLAYILTRPLGANLGDWLGSPRDQQGLGLGVALTSVIFLAAILATVVYLTTQPRRRDRRAGIDPHPGGDRRGRLANASCSGFTPSSPSPPAPCWSGGRAAARRPAAGAEESGPVDATLAPGQSATAHFPAAEVAKFRTIAADTLAKVRAGDQTAATARIKDLETAWDDDQPRLQPLDDTSWSVLDGQIDSALKAVRARKPDPATETKTLTTLLTSLW